MQSEVEHYVSSSHSKALMTFFSPAPLTDSASGSDESHSGSTTVGITAPSARSSRLACGREPDDWGVVRETQAFSGVAIKRPISAAVTGNGNSSVFRHAVQRVALPYVLAESGLRLRERTKRPEIGGVNRTFFNSLVANGNFDEAALIDVRDVTLPRPPV
jgi:hypothetical protein